MYGSDMYDLITCRHICVRVLGCCSFYVSHLSCVDKSRKKDDTCTQQEYDVDVIVLCNIEKKTPDLRELSQIIHEATKHALYVQVGS